MIEVNTFVQSVRACQENRIIYCVQTVTKKFKNNNNNKKKIYMK